jgi:hypothetical protein
MVAREDGFVNQNKKKKLTKRYGNPAAPVFSRADLFTFRVFPV